MGCCLAKKRQRKDNSSENEGQEIARQTINPPVFQPNIKKLNGISKSYNKNIFKNYKKNITKVSENSCNGISFNPKSNDDIAKETKPNITNNDNYEFCHDGQEAVDHANGIENMSNLERISFYSQDQYDELSLRSFKSSLQSVTDWHSYKSDFESMRSLDCYHNDVIEQENRDFDRNSLSIYHDDIQETQVTKVSTQCSCGEKIDDSYNTENFANDNVSTNTLIPEMDSTKWSVNMPIINSVFSVTESGVCIQVGEILEAKIGANNSLMIWGREF